MEIIVRSLARSVHYSTGVWISPVSPNVTTHSLGEMHLNINAMRVISLRKMIHAASVSLIFSSFLSMCVCDLKARRDLSSGALEIATRVPARVAIRRLSDP
jgi:hypothetical protein